MGSWSFILTDLAFNPLGEILNASDRKVGLPVNKVPTASFKVRLDNPLFNDLASAECYVKAYRNGVLKFFGPVVSAEDVGEREVASLAVTAAGQAWILALKLAGKSAAGINQTVAADRAQMFQQFIIDRNAENETHIDTSTAVSASSATTYKASPYKPMSEILLDLASTFDGFDWRFDPIENFAGGVVTGTKIAAFKAQPTFGVTQPEAIFEWGGGRNNVVSYKRTLTRETQANYVYHNVDAGPDSPGAPTVFATNADSIAKWGRLEALAQADILDNTLRQRLVDEHARVRAWPRQVIEFQPHLSDATTRVPEYGMDYSEADIVRARIMNQGETRLDALTRVWAVNFDISPENTETITLVLSEEGT